MQLGNRINEKEKRMYDLEDRHLEIIQRTKKTE